MSNLGNVQTYHRRGSVGEAPSRQAIFVRFWKKRYFNPIGLHFARAHSHLKEIDF